MNVRSIFYMLNHHLHANSNIFVNIMENLNIFRVIGYNVYTEMYLYAKFDHIHVAMHATLSVPDTYTSYCAISHMHYYCISKHRELPDASLCGDSLCSLL